MILSAAINMILEHGSHRTYMMMRDDWFRFTLLSVTKTALLLLIWQSTKWLFIEQYDFWKTWYIYLIHRFICVELKIGSGKRFWHSQIDVAIIIVWLKVWDLELDIGIWNWNQVFTKIQNRFAFFCQGIDRGRICH